MILIARFTLILLLVNNLHGWSQTAETVKTISKIAETHDSIIEWTRGARLGCNVFPIIMSSLQPSRKGFEFSIDTRTSLNLYPTFELGFENSYLNKDYIHYNSNGLYGRIGVDYNIRTSDIKSNDIFFVGGRYGIFAMQHKIDKLSITDTLWGPQVDGSYPQTNSYGHWLELVAGIKVEILHNLYLGWSLRTKVLLTSSFGVNYPHYMPGFGNGSNKINLGVTYSVYYQIPLMKVRTKIKIKKPEKDSESDETPKNQVQDSQMQYNNNH